MPRLLTKLVHRRHACDALAVSPRSFWRHWHPVFTETRSKDDQRAGCERKVFEDELAVAVEAGGGSRARVAVLTYRGKLGRKVVA